MIVTVYDECLSVYICYAYPK